MGDLYYGVLQMNEILSELEKLEKSATPKPWDGCICRWDDSASWSGTGPILDQDLCEEAGIDAEKQAAIDMKFIVAMRNALPALIAELRAAREFMPAATTAKEIVKATKLLMSSEGLDQSQIKLYLKSLIKQYDEVTGAGGEK